MSTKINSAKKTINPLKPKCTKLFKWFFKIDKLFGKISRQKFSTVKQKFLYDFLKSTSYLGQLNPLVGCSGTFCSKETRYGSILVHWATRYFWHLKLQNQGMKGLNSSILLNDKFCVNYYSSMWHRSFASVFMSLDKNDRKPECLSFWFCFPHLP